MGRDVSGNGSSESMYDEGDQNLDRRVGNNSVVDHRSRRPVLSPLHNCVDRCVNAASQQD